MEEPAVGHKRTQRSKSKNACDYCRWKKAKCGAERPCSNCLRKGIECTSRPEAAHPPTKLDREFGSLSDKIERLENKIDTLIRAASPRDGKGELKVTPVLEDIPTRIITSGITDARKITTTTASPTSQLKVNHENLFNEEDLLTSVVDDLVPRIEPLKFPGADAAYKIMSPGQLIQTQMTPRSQTGGAGSTSVSMIDLNLILSDDSSDFSQRFLNEVFDIHTKNPYSISFFYDYHDLFDMFPESSLFHDYRRSVMDISSLVDTESKTKVSLTSRQRTILKEQRASLQGRIDTSFLQTCSSLNMSIAYADELFESYLEHIYPFYPIVCEATIADIQKQVYSTGLTLSTAGCEYYLLLALGEATKATESCHYWSSDSYKVVSEDRDRNIEGTKVQVPPGYEYFWQALGMIGRLKDVLRTGFDKITIQLLVCVYYMKTCQLNDLKREVLEGSDMLFKFLELEAHKHSHRDILLRLYWVFLHLERSLYNMNLLDGTSSLIDIQEKVSIPRGCKSTYNLVRDADTFYSNCFMQNILLANIDDKARVMRSELLKSITRDETNEKASFYECLRIFIKFEYELNTWRTFLPFNFQWEDDISIRSTHIEIDLLKMKYYLCYVTVCEFLILDFEKRFDDDSDHSIQNIDNETLRLYCNQIEMMTKKALSFTIKAQNIFSRQSLIDLDPVICTQLMNSLYFIMLSKTIQKYRIQLEDHFRQLSTGFSRSQQKMRCFSLHSPRLNSRFELLRHLFENIM
jgi:hypothetical protein